MKHSKKWFTSLFKRRIQVAILLLLQILFIAFLVMSGSNYLVFSMSLSIISFFAALHVLAKNDRSAYKLTWLFLILLFSLFGGLFYLLFKFQSSTRKFAKKLDNIDKKNKEMFFLPGDNKNNSDVPLINYLEKYNNYPCYDKTAVNYLESGEVMFEQLLEQLNKAEKYIFLEFYIINEGKMWNSVLKILKKKASNGVEVKVICDDMGCLFFLPNNFVNEMNSYGIKCTVFNPFRPLLTSVQNNRDHRKIVVIDGKVAFTGGINLADEYINLYDRCGHWKDAGIMLTGKAAWSFALMFLQMWMIATNDNLDCFKYYPWSNERCNISSKGYVQPYADSPMDRENISEYIYLNIINNSKKYVYINTPYLIIDENMILALTMASKSGVDVRILVPYKWDKRLVHFTTKSYYRTLIKAGVKIYEYSPGFVHSKSFVSDDKVAVIGTANLDFRSLYLNFECGACLYDAECIHNMKKDFLDSIKISKEISIDDCKNNFFIRILQDFCRLFAPLM